MSEAFRHHHVQCENETAEQQQGERVPQPPGCAQFDGLAYRLSTGSQGGQRGNVVGLYRVLHAEQQS